MVSGEFFDQVRAGYRGNFAGWCQPFRFGQLHTCAQRFKNNKLPFGGIQLVVCGDFFQLPVSHVFFYILIFLLNMQRMQPVTVGTEEKNFCFEAAAWKKSLPFQIELQQVCVTFLKQFKVMHPPLFVGRFSGNKTRCL
jgi:ATP-dependent DNA helicase PIF1